MKKFIVYNEQKEILRVGLCQNSTFYLQAKEDEFVMEGKAEGLNQKIEFDSLDDEGQPINPRVVDKTPEEIEADKPPERKPIPFEKQSANITNEQLQGILDRLSDLEK